MTQHIDTSRLLYARQVAHGLTDAISGMIERENETMRAISADRAIRDLTMLAGMLGFTVSRPEPRKVDTYQLDPNDAFSPFIHEWVGIAGERETAMAREAAAEDHVWRLRAAEGQGVEP